MRRLVFLVLLAASAASAQDSPFDLYRARPGDGPASAYLRLRDAEETYRRTDQWDRYVQYRAQAAAPLGLHAEALRWWDARRGDAPDAVSPPNALPAGTRAVDAAEWIAAHAPQVVMVNEAHHDASSRLLTLRLLPLLYDKGFRYFAAETFAVDSVLTAQPGYPTPAMGTYLSDPVFAAVVREALRLGYTLVPYEIEEDEEDDRVDRQVLRDSLQAVHLAERTIGRDPQARVLVHAGFAHIYEADTEYWRPMAAFFRERTGIDPLTVDQTRRGESSVPAYESAVYRGTLSRIGDAPAILLDSADVPLRLDVDAPVDVVVARPRTVYADGRPTWMALGGTRVPHVVRLPEACAETVCVVEIRRQDEPGSTPLDRAIADRAAAVTVYAHPGENYETTVLDGRSGETLATNLHLPDVDY